MPFRTGTGPIRTKIGKDAIVGTLLLVLFVAAIIAFLVLRNSSSPHDDQLPTYGTYSDAAVSCDSPYCAQIAKYILEKGGSVADAAIAGLLAMGVVHSQSMGIGGGFLMILYNATTKKSRMLNARETAPAFATEGMFGGDSNKSQIGGLAVGIPGEVRGYWELWEGHGRLKWKELFEPAIHLAQKGFNVTAHTAFSISNEWEVIQKSPTMLDIFMNPKTKKAFKEGELMTRPTLATTLKLIADKGADEFYEGDVGKWFVEDLKGLGGNITMEDMKNYKVNWSDPLSIPVHGNLTLLATPPPGSGLLLGFILNVLSEYEFDADSIGSKKETVQTYQRIVEAFKHAYAYRTLLGDPFDQSIADTVHELIRNLTSADFVSGIRKKIDETKNKTRNDYEFYGAKFYTPDDHGTAHISIISPTGDAISVTSTINTYFGARIRSRKTDIIYNNEMDDFAAPGIKNYFGVPPSVNNLIKPGKRPLSSMTPAIFIDEMGKPKLVIGAAGGTKIITSTALASIRSLWFEEDLKTAIDTPRFHHQLYPMELDFELELDSALGQSFRALGHDLRPSHLRSAVTAVGINKNGTISAKADKRKPGSVAGIHLPKYN